MITRDVSLEAWKILRVLNEVQKASGRVTLATLADLVRGLGGGNFAVASAKGKGKRQAASGEKGSLDVDDIVGGKVTLNKEVSAPYVVSQS